MQSGHPRTNLEHEAKLIASTSFCMPNLDRITPTSTTHEPRHEVLDATYFDTADLALARAGITLRHRDEYMHQPWTLKLPVTHTARALVRNEISLDGPADQVPADAADLVRAYCRSQPLIRVAMLHTSRTKIEVAGFDGELVAEVVDDTVTVHDGPHDNTTFREIEVELRRQDPHGISVFDEITKRLVGAGAEPEPPLPKLVRALGAAAAAPPDVVRHDLFVKKKSHPTTRTLVRTALAASVVAIVHNDAGVRIGDDPESLHAFRVATRQLRSHLRTFAPFLDPEWTSALRAELAWLGASLGTVRECDVLADRLQMQQPLLAQRHTAVVELLLHALAVERDNARRTLLTDMRSDRYDQLIDDLIVAAKQPPFSSEHHRQLRDQAARVGARLTRRSWKSLVKAVRAAGKHPSHDALHRVRIRAKRCRYSAESIAPLVGKPAVRFANAMRSLQDTLGAHHDAGLAHEWFTRAAQAIPMSGECVDDLIALGARERTDIENAWPKLAKKLLGDARLVAWLTSK